MTNNGQDILPLVTAPSPALALHAANSITALQTLATEKPALAQMRALTYAVRWEMGIDMRDFLGDILEGERWLVHAAGAVRHFSSVLHLPHSDECVQGRRTTNSVAALARRIPYVQEGRLASCRTMASLCRRPTGEGRHSEWRVCLCWDPLMGLQKPLALYLFRQSHQLYRTLSDKNLSPSFWESEDRSPSSWQGFDAVLPGIEHELGMINCMNLKCSLAEMG